MGIYTCSIINYWCGGRICVTAVDSGVCVFWEQFSVFLTICDKIYMPEPGRAGF